MDEIKSMYLQFPVVPRVFMTATLLVTLVSSVIYPDIIYYLYIEWEKIKFFQIWRILTNFFFIGKFGPNIIWDILFLYFAVTRAQSIFNEKQVDEQIWMYVCLMIPLSIMALAFKEVFMSNALLFALVYVWCKKQPFEEVRFFFGLKFKSGYFPFVLIAFHLITGASVYHDLYGLAAGHAYIFFKDIYPVSSGSNYLRTPRFLTKLVNKYILGGSQNEQAHRQQQQEQQQQPAFQGFRAFQGRGVRLE